MSQRILYHKLCCTHRTKVTELATFCCCSLSPRHPILLWIVPYSGGIDRRSLVFSFPFGSLTTVSGRGEKPRFSEHRRPTYIREFVRAYFFPRCSDGRHATKREREGEARDGGPSHIARGAHRHPCIEEETLSGGTPQAMKCCTSHPPQPHASSSDTCSLVLPFSALSLCYSLIEV